MRACVDFINSRQAKLLIIFFQLSQFFHLIINIGKWLRIVVRQQTFSFYHCTSIENRSLAHSWCFYYLIIRSCYVSGLKWRRRTITWIITLMELTGNCGEGAQRRIISLFNSNVLKWLIILYIYGPIEKAVEQVNRIDDRRSARRGRSWNDPILKSRFLLWHRHDKLKKEMCARLM